MCIYVSMHGIVVIEIYSYNKSVNTLYTVVVSLSNIPPKCANTRESKDEHCVLWCTHINYNIHNPIPLDNLKNHTALLYITWGLVWDSKNRRKESLRLKLFLPDKHQGFQSQRGDLHADKPQISKERRKNPSCQICCWTSF